MEQYAEPMSTSVLDEVLPSSTVEALLHEEHDRHKIDVMLPTEELGTKLVSAAFDKFQLGRIIPRAYFEDCLKKGMVESDITFKGLCELDLFRTSTLKSIERLTRSLPAIECRLCDSRAGFPRRAQYSRLRSFTTRSKDC